MQELAVLAIAIGSSETSDKHGFRLNAVTLLMYTLSPTQKKLCLLK